MSVFPWSFDEIVFIMVFWQNLWFFCDLLTFWQNLSFFWDLFTKFCIFWHNLRLFVTYDEICLLNHRLLTKLAFFHDLLMKSAFYPWSLDKIFVSYRYFWRNMGLFSWNIRHLQSLHEISFSAIFRWNPPPPPRYFNVISAFPKIF